MTPPALDEASTQRRLDRWSGGCLIAAGVLLLPGVAHPDIFETTLAHAALDTDLWIPMHAAGVLVAALTLVGLTGLYATRAPQLGRLGAVGFALAVPGLVMTGAVAWAEAFLLPVLAREDPAVFDWNGPVTTDWAVRATAGLALLWMVGLLLLGLAGSRSGVLPVAAGLTLAGAAVAFIAFGVLLIPVLARLSIVALAVGYAMVGLALWTGTSGHLARPVGPPTAAGNSEGAGAGPRGRHRSVT